MSTHIESMPGREVDFFLRIHRHLPDQHCGTSALSDCEYRDDKRPINEANKPLDELEEDAEFRGKEAEVIAAVNKKWEEEGWATTKPTEETQE